MKHFIAPGVLALAVAAMAGWFFYMQLECERTYQAGFGLDWVSVYEKQEGTLADARERLAVGTIGGFAIVALVFVIYGATMPRGPINSRRNRSDRPWY